MTDPSLAFALRDRYVLERELGRGGMATVYLALDLKHKRHVALKVLRPELAATLGPDRFRREIETAARLQHPHICSVFDSGEDDGRLWFTMPWIRGESLRDRLRRDGRLPVTDAIRIASEAGRALDYAHREGFVHRDVKPENLLLTPEGDTLVADFGIARALAGAASDAGQHLTDSGVAVGTAVYMAPEQASGGRTDARADQYALAVTCWEMLTGQPPFPGRTAAAIVADRFRSPTPSLRASRPDAPEAVDGALRRALALEPAHRFGAMSDFVGSLGGLATPPRRRWARPALAVVLALVLLASAVLALGRRSHAPAAAPASPASPTRLAVLPFENLGDSADAYFADGVSDEVRGKLTALPGLEVIARASSVPYRRSAEPPQQIARELGVRYLLTGTVRWDKRGGSRVRVSPELIDAGGGGAPASRWQQPFDAALTDVFQVQADIAGRVAQALGVALGDSARQELSERPTANLAAYDAFLRGEALAQEFLGVDPRTMPGAISYFEQAVTLDSTFVAAWAQLARARANQYTSNTPLPALAEGARQAAERARAIGPTRPDPYLALGEYYSLVRLDNVRSLEAFETGLRLAPTSVALLTGAGRTEARLGRWNDALASWAKARTLDPRSAVTWRRYGQALLMMRRYREARVALDRGLALAPTSFDLLEQHAVLALAQGDTAGARAVARHPPPGVDSTDLAVWFATTYDLYWILDDQAQRRVLALPLSAFADNREQWAIVRAQIHSARGELPAARVWADSALVEFTRGVRTAPDNAQQHVFRGLMLAYLGRRAEAIAEGERAVALAPISHDAFVGPYIQQQLVRIYLVLGDETSALSRLAPLLQVPCNLSPAWLRVDPNFAPLRGDARFERLVAGRTG